MNRADFQQAINNAGLVSHMNQIQRALLEKVLAALCPSQDEMDTPQSIDALKSSDRELLNSVGPASAQAAVDFALNATRGQFDNLQFNCDHVQNVQLVQNDPSYPAFSQVLRQFLLPRSAYYDFDSLVDPRHRIDHECGYPRWITPFMYRFLYDRDDVARRVVNIYPDESWAADPEVYEDEDEENWTPFEISWLILCQDLDLMQHLYRIDCLSGIGHYGVLLVGLNDGMPLDAPVDEPDLLMGKRNVVGTKQREVMYFRPFDEYLSFVQEYEKNPNSPRYGLPNYYNLVFLDMTTDAAGATVGTRLMRRVHWSRVIHMTENLESSFVFHVPRMRPVFNRILDLRKIKGGSSEMFWKGAFPGIAFELDPRIVADNPDFDKDKFSQELDAYSEGLKRYIGLVGIHAQSLAPQVADPTNHVRVQIDAIASHFGIPSRIFMGSEESRLASSQDKLTWNQRLKRRLRMTTEPNIRKVINRLIALGVMPPPTLKDRRTGLTTFHVGWGDLNTTTDEDKANLALKWSQAMSQYVASGLIHLIKPMDYLTMILGLRPRDAIKVIAGTDMTKLQKVDPSQGAGVNGKRQNVAGDAPDKQVTGHEGQ